MLGLRIWTRRTIGVLQSAHETIPYQMTSEPPQVAAFREWLAHKGAYVHPSLQFVKDVSGMSVYTTEEIPADVHIVSCPFTLAITPEISKQALRTLSRHNTERNAALDALSERELVCTYLVIHWILEEQSLDQNLNSLTAFEHLPYLHMLPPSDALRTALHFNENELFLLKGTNLFAATADRKSKREAEWEQCRNFASSARPEWADMFTWQRYLTASAYLSSRAFPSTVLSRTPSLVSTDSSHPILLPVVDSLNHARAHRVSWMVSGTQPKTPSSQSGPLELETRSQISLVIHSISPANTEVFNNYGPKPNSELILGYGFSLPSNPDDTIVLKIGGPGGATVGQRWEVGRDARGAEGLWKELKALLDVGSDHGEEVAAEWELDLEAAEMLKEMVENKLEALPKLPEIEPEGVRDEVWSMVQHYVQGQRDVLQSLSAFADTKREDAFTKAKEEGVELVFEEQDEER